MPQKRSLKAVFLNAVAMVAAGAKEGGYCWWFSKAMLCVRFVWPSSSSSIKYNTTIQCSAWCGQIMWLLCVLLWGWDGSRASVRCRYWTLFHKHQTLNTQYSGHWDPENTLQSPAFSAAINEERTSLGASGWQKVMVTHFLSLAAQTQFVNITSTGLIINQPRPENKIFPGGCKICWKL